MTIDAPTPLAAAFLPANEADWRSAAGRSGGAGSAHLSDDGIPIGPLYPRRRDAAQIWRTGAQQGRTVVSRLSATNFGGLEAEIADDVAGGGNGLEVAFAGSVHPLAIALPPSADLLAGLIRAVPEGYAVRFDAGPETPILAGDMIEAAKRKRLVLDLSHDPLAASAALGASPPIAPEAMARTAAAFEAAGLSGTAATADGRIWHAAGASEVQELAAVLATVVEQVRMLGGDSVERAMARIGVALAADADQLLTTAKFRAMRLLLGRVAEAAGVSPSPVRIHAETAWRMMSRSEPRMNTLRASGAAFAAAVGGADSIAVLPFDVLEGATPAGRRLARNTQTILAEESHLARFADPSAGSGAVEALTDALAERAWERFQRIEAQGGMAAALRSGGLQREVAATRDARLERMRAGDIRMVGVNAYSEEAAAKGDAPEALPGDEVGLLFRRLAEESERPRR